MKFEIYHQNASLLASAAGPDYRWRLRGDNGKIIADSGEGYRNKADCMHGIDLVKGTSATTLVEDTTGTGLLRSIASRGLS